MRWSACPLEPEATMLDLFFLAVAVAFFAVALAYVRACERM